MWQNCLQHLFVAALSQGGEVGHTLGQAGHGIVQLCQGMHLAAEANRARGAGIDQLRCEQQVGEGGGADQAEQALHLFVGDEEAEAGHREPKAGIVGGDAQVAVGGQQQAAADTVAFDGGDGRFAEGEQAVECGLDMCVVLFGLLAIAAVLLKLGNVAAGTKACRPLPDSNT